MESTILSVRIDQTDQMAFVSLRGELDMSSVQILNRSLQTEAATCHEVIIDLEGLSFMDSTGLGALIEARKSAENDGRVLRIIRPSPPVMRVFETCGTTFLIDSFDGKTAQRDLRFLDVLTTGKDTIPGQVSTVPGN